MCKGTVTIKLRQKEANINRLYSIYDLSHQNESLTHNFPTFGRTLTWRLFVSTQLARYPTNYA